MKAKLLLCLALITVCPAILSAQAVITVNAKQNGEPVSQTLMGFFHESVNGETNGALYSERVMNRSFEYSTSDGAGYSPLSGWTLVTRGGGDASIRVDNATPLNTNNTHYLSLVIRNPGSGVGALNGGFNGMKMTKGETYYFSFYAKRSESNNAPFDIRIESQSGALYAQAQIASITGSWAKYTASLVSNADDLNARLVVLATGTGTVNMDMISLFPKTTYKNRPNGLRPDFVQMYADFKPGFLRFPGGCTVHGAGLANAYRWKNSIGDVAERKEDVSIWGPQNHQTRGFGFYEYFLLAEDIGALPIPVIPVGVSCQFWGTYEVVPLDQMGPWVQDALDLVEFANGPATSTWGAKRAAMGHPEPFNMEYLALGNEERINTQFDERCTMIYNAVRAKYPDLKIIANSGPGASGPDFDQGWAIAKRWNVYEVDEHYYNDASWFNYSNTRYDRYDRNGPKVMVGEYSVSPIRNDWLGALTEAGFTTGLERNGGLIEFSSYGPTIENLYRSDKNSITVNVKWNAEKMFSQNLADTNLAYTLQGVPGGIRVSAGKDNETKDIIIKIVNTAGTSVASTIKISGIDSVAPSAKAIVLSSGDLNATNLAPTEKTIAVKTSFAYNIPAYSFTVLRIGTSSVTGVETPRTKPAKNAASLRIRGNEIVLPANFARKPLYLEIYDLQGRQLWTRSLAATRSAATIVSLPVSLNGIYLVRCKTASSEEVAKFVNMGSR